MKILIYSHSFAPHIGGVETYINLLADGLASEGHCVMVVTKTTRSALDDSSLRFAVIRRPGLRALCRLIHSAGILHLAGPCLVPLLFGLLLRKPVVVEHHGYQACCPNGLLLVQPGLDICSGQFQKRNYGLCLRCEASRAGILTGFRSLVLTAVRRKLCRLAGANVAVSHHLARRLDMRRTQVIYHGVPESQCRAAASSSSRVLTFGYIGRMVAEKGLTVLIAAVNRLHREGHDFRLRLIGDGPERSRLERLAARAGLQPLVTFSGPVSNGQLDEVTNDLDVIVTPSICEETAGLVTIEQMMRGRAIMAADIGGLSEIVDGAGITFTPGDPEILAARMRQLILQPGLVDDLGLRARARAVSLFRQERMVAEHRALYEQLFSSAS